MSQLTATSLFHKRLFWDVNPDNLRLDEKARFIIERVWERGDVPDIRACRRYYGDDKIREILTSAKWLSLKTIYLACACLSNQLTDYKCYNTAQSNHEHWSY